MKILETERLLLREATGNDAEFVLDLLNQPSFKKFIGDRGVRTSEQAREYIKSRFTSSYRDNGFGLYLVELQVNEGDQAADQPASALPPVLSLVML